MLTATLGGLIKDYRLKKRLSQQEVSLRIGWSDSTRLSKIEQGRVGKPTIETIEKIINALDLTEQEKGEFLFTGGYLPTEKEIKKFVKENKERLDKWKYPAYLIDFSWRCLYMNTKTADAFGFSEKLLKSIPKLKPNLLEFVIAPKEVMPVEIFKGDDEESLQPFNIAQIAQFKVEQIGRENDSWYKKLIEKLAGNENFRKIWNEATVEIYHKKLLDYEYKVIKWPNSKKPIQKYNLFTTRLISDPRFQIVLYYPAD